MEKFFSEILIHNSKIGDYALRDGEAESFRVAFGLQILFSPQYLITWAMLHQ